MKFAAKAGCNGRARAGVLQLGSCPQPIETPALLLTTRKGLPLFISPDLLPSLPFPDSHLLQFSPLHFLDGISPKTISNMGGVHQMFGLHEHVLAAIPRDSVMSLPEYESTNETEASFETPCGRRLIKPADYMEMISSMKPDLWVSLADEVPAWVSSRRNRASVDCTLRWLDDCTSLNGTGGILFGSIVGGSGVDERRRCAEEVSRRNASGFWIGGFGLGESLDERSALLTAITDALPEDKPQQVCGLGLPEKVLQGLAAGIDQFDSTKDMSPIVDSCNCFTCQNHTKAYINHFFNGHEMLAHILLEIHNTHHYLGFFHSIREAIEDGKFEQFRKSIVGSRRDHLLPP